MSPHTTPQLQAAASISPPCCACRPRPCPLSLPASLLGTAAAAIVLGARRGGVLLPVLVLPLAVPVLIFGTAAADAVTVGLTPRPHLQLLAAFLCAATPLCPIAAGAALKAAAD